MQAIEVKFLPATNFRDARVKAFTVSHALTVPFQYELSDRVAQAQEAVQQLIYQAGWTVKITGCGVLKNGNYVFTIK